MSVRRSPRLGLCLGALIPLLWACSGDEPTTAPQTPTASAEAAATATPAPATDPPDTAPPPTATAAPYCGDGRLADDEACDDGGQADGDGCSGECRVEPFYTCLGEPSACAADPAVCGDGVIHPTEACDDGDDEGGDGCSASCEVEPLYTCQRQPSVCALLPAVCGDGLIHPSEACDDHNPIGGDGCSQACEIEDFYTCAGQPSDCELVPIDCGDGQVHPLEECDQGESNSDEQPDTCRTDCTLPSCGDGVLDQSELCDDGAGNSDSRPGACRTNCHPAGCGDGVKEGAEGCDEGDENSNVLADACRTDCQPARCGDGVVDALEACDAGPNNSDIIADACRTDCQEASCGDGILDSDEGCDDGDGNSDTAPGACRSSCQPAYCGDGILDPGEECDDGAGNVGGVLAACTPECQVALEYQRVATLSAAGAVISGSAAELTRRLWDEAASCKVRFDSRVHDVHHVERTQAGYLLDFHGLSAWDRLSDSYAYVVLEPGVRAGLGTSERPSDPALLGLKDRAQHAEISFTAYTVDVYCSRRNPYALVGAFDEDGLPTAGSFDATYAAAVDAAADCKVRVDDRLFDTPHVEYDDYLLYLDVLSLGDARLQNADTYVSVEISSGVRAGFGVLGRRGNVNQIYNRDRANGDIDSWQAAPVEVYCADRYAPVLTMAPGGSVVGGGTIQDILTLQTAEGRRCKARFDNRVATPSKVEYGQDVVRMDLMNQHAYHDGADAMAYVELNLGHRAGIGAVLRRGVDKDISKPTLQQYPAGGSASVDYRVDILCEDEPSWVATYGMDAAGVDTLGDWTDFYTLVTTRALECRLATDGEIGDPVMVEYTSGQLLFDYHGLSAYSGDSEAYATHVLKQLSQSGRAGSYRRGSALDIGGRDRDQAPLSTVSPKAVQVFCR